MSFSTVPESDDGEHRERARLKIDEILMISAERRCADIISADVEHYRVPFKDECRSDLRRKRERFDTGACIVRRDKPYLLLLDHLAALGKSEICVDHIKVYKFCPVSACGGLHCEVQSKLAFAAVVADEDFNVFHRR